MKIPWPSRPAIGKDRGETMKNQATDIELLLSAYVDGELEPEERAEVEALLEAEPTLKLRLEDHRALSASLRFTLEQEADAVDFSGFADGVMAKLPARSPGLGERIRGFLGDFLGERRHRFALGAVTAAVVAVASAPFFVIRPPLPEYRLVAKTEEAPLSAGLLLAGDASAADVLSVEATGDYETMLIKTSAGTTIIYVQEAQ